MVFGLLIGLAMNRGDNGRPCGKGNVLTRISAVLERDVVLVEIAYMGPMTRTMEISEGDLFHRLCRSLQFFESTTPSHPVYAKQAADVKIVTKDEVFRISCRWMIEGIGDRPSHVFEIGEGKYYRKAALNEELFAILNLQIHDEDDNGVQNTASEIDVEG
jgi:hypothetical protein